jgi:hypothetical protein
MPFFQPVSLDLQLSANTLTQNATTTAVGGNSVFGDGGDANATSVQVGSIVDNDALISPDGGNHFPWGGGPVADIDLQISANTLTQTGTTTAVGGFSVFGNGGDADATSVQVGSITDNDLLIG